MAAIRVTTKRQATLPKALCDDLRLKPGDTIVLESREIDGEKVWLMKAQSDAPPTWYASLRRYAAGRPMDMASVRNSVAKGRRRGNS